MGAQALTGDRGAAASKLPLLAAAATGVQVGAAIVASRFVLAEVPPLMLAMLRYAVGFLCLLPFALAALRPPRAQRRTDTVGRSRASDLLAMAALGVGQFGVLIALLNFGLQRVGAAQAAMIFSLFPLLTLLLAAAMGRERVTPALLLGVLLSVAGVALSLLPKLGAAPLAGTGGWASRRSPPRPAPARCAACCTALTCSAIRPCRCRRSRCWPRWRCWRCWLCPKAGRRALAA